MTTLTQIPGRPMDTILVPVANGVTPDQHWDTTTFEGQDGKVYVKHQKLKLGRKPAFVAKWFLLEEN